MTTDGQIVANYFKDSADDKYNTKTDTLVNEGSLMLVKRG